MEHSFVGIDVAKDQLDVHLRPTGEAFRVAHDAPASPHCLRVFARSALR
jgi:hypothetical protein